jgi:hypothetical protein
VVTGSGAAAVIAVLDEHLGNWDETSVRRRSNLSRLLRWMQREGKWAGFCLDDLNRWRLDDPLPSPAEQLNTLISLVGERQSDPATGFSSTVYEVEAWIGARINLRSPGSNLIWLVDQEENSCFFSPCHIRDNDEIDIALSMRGWERFYDLQRGRIDSRKAFMAMKFNEPIVGSAYSNCFRPAASRAGFDLFDLRDQQQAGMIDDQMRVAIRNSRFVVADLTYACRGSYWEGGFAEGLGRPVIYTCEKAMWDREKSHFDTNHLTTVIWDVDDLASAERQLTAIIRNTLPGEAKMDD